MPNNLMEYVLEQWIYFYLWYDFIISEITIEDDEAIVKEKQITEVQGPDKSKF